MSQAKKQKKRISARAHKQRKESVAKRSGYKPVKRIGYKCRQCSEIVVRKETETVPKRCPFCQIKNPGFVIQVDYDAV